jgi:hypothetical protein
MSSPLGRGEGPYVIKYRFCWNVMLLQMFYPLKHFPLPYLVILKQTSNNLTYTLIMSMYAFYVFLCILVLSRIPQSILMRRTAHFWDGSVTTIILRYVHLKICEIAYILKRSVFWFLAPSKLLPLNMKSFYFIGYHITDDTSHTHCPFGN